jgi:hypothetical protein
VPPITENLLITIEDSAAEAYALAAIEALRRRGARRVYFRGVNGYEYPSLARLGPQGVIVVPAGLEPANFFASARVIHDEGELTITSDKPLREDQWRELGESIAADVARMANSA